MQTHSAVSRFCSYDPRRDLPPDIGNLRMTSVYLLHFSTVLAQRARSCQPASPSPVRCVRQISLFFRWKNGIARGPASITGADTSL